MRFGDITGWFQRPESGLVCLCTPCTRLTENHVFRDVPTRWRHSASSKVAAPPWPRRRSPARSRAAAPWRALYLDSLGGSNSRASMLLASFLKCVSEDKEQPSAGADTVMSAVRVQVPQQHNGYDCGFYLVMCARPHPLRAPCLAASSRPPSFASHCGAPSCLTGDAVPRDAQVCEQAGGQSRGAQQALERAGGWLTPSSTWPLPSGSTADPPTHARTHARTRPPNQQLAAHCYLPGFPPAPVYLGRDRHPARRHARNGQ